MSPSAHGTESVARRGAEILRKAGVALQNRPVEIWETSETGQVTPVTLGAQQPPSPRAVGEMEATLRRWGVAGLGRRWVACRLDDFGRWCIAPVRTELPTPPPGRERRGRERMTLELAGLCLGLLDRRPTTPVPHRSANDKLRENQARTELLLQRMPAILWTTDSDLRITSVAGAGLGALGLRPSLVLGRFVLEGFGGDPSDLHVLAAHREALAGEPVSYSIQLGSRWYDAHVEPLRDERSAVSGVVGIAQDVTERAHALRTLERERAETEEFFDHAALALNCLAADGTIERANRAELDLVGYDRDDYVGHNITEFHADTEVGEHLLRCLAAGEALREFEARLRRRDDSIVTVQITSNVLFRDGVYVHARCFTRDVTELKAAEARLRQGVLHDHLTGLPNRVMFTERVGEAIKLAERRPDHRFAVLFADLDHFKVVNDSLGHVVGDQLLLSIAHRFESCTRPGDLVARVGGDEFAVLIEDIGDGRDALMVAERVQRDFGAPFEVDGHELFVSVSLGVTMNLTTYHAAEDVIRDADIAMSRAKTLGRSRYEVFDVAMRDRAQSRLRLHTDLRRAIDRCEFRLVFQPIVHLDTGRLDGFEALVRWHHPERGVVDPPDFIPLAEETGLIVPLGRWVIREACRCAAGWQRTRERREPIRLSVNLSVHQLEASDLVHDVRSALEEFELDPHLLRLEITETGIMENVALSGERLRELHELGAEVHMDDFGTGYSSLANLRGFPVSALKIDRSFIRRMGTRRGDLEVVRTIVGLAQNLGMRAIAEGVETEAQRNRLLDLGCPLGQGFWFGVPSDAIEAARIASVAT